LESSAVLAVTQVIKTHIRDQINDFGRHICFYLRVFDAEIDILRKGLPGIIE
jgi:hypothetical protein